MKTLKTNARISEVADTGSRLLILFGRETALAEDRILKPLFVAIKSDTDLLTDIIKSDRQASDLDKADALRDEVIRNLATLLKGYTAMPIQALQQAGQRLYAIFEKYGMGIIRENYAVQSAHIESMLKDFAEPTLASDIAQLTGVAEVIAQLTKAQKDFNDRRVSYEQATATQSSKTKSTELKKRLLGSINTALLPYLLSMKNLNQSEYISFANAVGQVIADTNAAISARSKKEAKDNK